MLLISFDANRKLCEQPSREIGVRPRNRNKWLLLIVFGANAIKTNGHRSQANKFSRVRRPPPLPAAGGVQISPLKSPPKPLWLQHINFLQLARAAIRFKPLLMNKGWWFFLLDNYSKHQIIFFLALRQLSMLYILLLCSIQTFTK
jgi:hypothetical protein